MGSLESEGEVRHLCAPSGPFSRHLGCFGWVFILVIGSCENARFSELRGSFVDVLWSPCSP